MRWNICCHTYCNTGSTIYKKVRISAWKYCRFFFCFIEVWYKINSIFIDICNHFHGYLGKPCLSISHCGSTISIHRTKITMSINKTISHGPWLSHVYQCSINRTVTMRMIFTHGISDDTSTFTMWLIGTIVKFYH